MSVIVSWGRYGGLYITRGRVCLGWVAITWIHMEIDDLMHMALHDVVEARCWDCNRKIGDVP